MPNYKGHVAGGFVSYAVILTILHKYTSPFRAVEWLFFSIAGALFPDIDTKSKGQKYFYRLVTVLLIYFVFQQQFVAATSVCAVALLPLLVRHRGILHNVWFVVGVPVAIWLWIHMYAPHLSRMILFDVIFFIGGALSHLWLDLGLRRMFR